MKVDFSFQVLGRTEKLCVVQLISWENLKTFLTTLWFDSGYSLKERGPEKSTLTPFVANRTEKVTLNAISMNEENSRYILLITEKRNFQIELDFQ